MIRVPSARAGVPGVLLVLALAGLLVMHGLDAGAVAHAGAEASTPSAASATPADHGVEPGSGKADRVVALAGPGPASRSEHGEAGRAPAAGPEGPAAHVGWGHLVAACVAVLATCAAGAIRRLLPSPGAPATRGLFPRAGGRARRPAVVRPPGPARVELCVLTC